MKHSILVADDEPNIRDVICFAIERAGMVPLPARNGKEAMMAFHRGGVDLAVLDIGMPEMDGLEVCRLMRKTSSLPILFLSARDEEIDRVLGLEIGGDDYVTKPFSTRELLARITAILKRTGKLGVDEDTAHLSAGRLLLDRAGRAVTFDGALIALTAIEFLILEALLARPGWVLSREQLMEKAYGPGTFVADRTIDSHIRNIRAKLTGVGSGPVICTVHGAGFKFDGGKDTA